MEVIINDLSAAEKQLEVKLEFDEIKAQFEKELKKLAAKVKIDGFRPGKAPMSMIQKIYGTSLQYDAAEQIAQDKFKQIVEEKDINYISRPEMVDFDFQMDKSLNFKVNYEVVPEIVAKDYKGLTLEIPWFETKDEDINEEINHFRNRDRVEEDADVVGEEENYLLKVSVAVQDKEGNFFNNGGNDLVIDMSNKNVNKDILSQAPGKKAGDTIVFSVEDKHMHKNEAGENEEHSHTVTYQLTINEVKKFTPRELDEAYIKKLTNNEAETEEGLKEFYRKQLDQYYTNINNRGLENKIISEIVKNNEFELPKQYLDRVAEDYLKHEEEEAKSKHKGFNKEKAKAYSKLQAEFDLKWVYTKRSILKQENIDITDEEIQIKAEEESVKTSIPVEKLLTYYKSSQKEHLIDDKLIEFLKENNTIIKKNPADFNQSEDEDTHNE